MTLIVAVTAVTKLERFGYQLVARSQETCRLSLNPPMNWLVDRVS